LRIMLFLQLLKQSSQRHNKHMHSDSKKQSEERAAFFAAGDVKR